MEQQFKKIGRTQPSDAGEITEFFSTLALRYDRASLAMTVPVL
jgi:hypothetical protein